MAPAKQKPGRRRGARPQRSRGSTTIRWRPLLAGAAMLLAAAAVVYGAGLLIDRLQAVPVERVVFAGDLRHARRDSLIERVRPHLGGGFWGADLDAIQGDLQRDPWVYRAEVERLWPRQLKITITEQQPIARWGRGGLLNHRGELFKPRHPFEADDLPLLAGPRGEAQRVMRLFQLVGQALGETPLRVQQLAVDERGSWAIKLDGGAVLELGRQQPLQKLQRFLLVYRKELKERFEQVVRVDTRYVNGVAVAWRQNS